MDIGVSTSFKQPKRRPLTLNEIKDAFAPLQEKYPPILFLEQACELSGYAPGTLKAKLSAGCFRDCVSRGKPLRFWRDRFVLELMNQPQSLPTGRPCATTAVKEPEPREIIP